MVTRNLTNRKRYTQRNPGKAGDQEDRSTAKCMVFRTFSSTPQYEEELFKVLFTINRHFKLTIQKLVVIHSLNALTTCTFLKGKDNWPVENKYFKVGIR